MNTRQPLSAGIGFAVTRSQCDYSSGFFSTAASFGRAVVRRVEMD